MPHVAKIPHPIPPPYDTFDPAWLAWVSLINGMILSLGKKGACLTKRGPGKVLQGQYVTVNGILPGGKASNWLPGAWIRILTRISRASQPKPCDCTPQELFDQGCPGH